MFHVPFFEYAFLEYVYYNMQLLTFIRWDNVEKCLCFLYVYMKNGTECLKVEEILK